MIPCCALTVGWMKTGQWGNVLVWEISIMNPLVRIISIVKIIQHCALSLARLRQQRSKNGNLSRSAAARFRSARCFENSLKKTQSKLSHRAGTYVYEGKQAWRSCHVMMRGEEAALADIM